MIKITTKVDTKKLDKKIKSIGPITKNTLKKIGEAEVLTVQNRIGITKTAPNGQRWAPWSISTMRARMRDGTAARGLLFRTGELFRSIYYKVKDLKLEVGAKAPHAEYLQNGTPNMPARPFLGFTQMTINRLKTLLKTELKK